MENRVEIVFTSLIAVSFFAMLFLFAFGDNLFPSSEFLGIPLDYLRLVSFFSCFLLILAWRFMLWYSAKGTRLTKFERCFIIAASSNSIGFFIIKVSPNINFEGNIEW